MGLKTLVDGGEDIQVPNHRPIKPSASHGLCRGEETSIGEACVENILKVGVQRTTTRVVNECASEHIRDSHICISLHGSNIKSCDLLIKECWQVLRVVVETSLDSESHNYAADPVSVEDLCC